MKSIPPDVATTLAIRLVPYTQPGSGGCILSTYHVNAATGYSSMSTKVDGRLQFFYAHRVMYTHIVGPIPAGMTLDHLCEVRNCVNPNHLEPVPIEVNILRSSRNPAAINARRAHCKRGHEFGERSDGRGRYCPTCKSERGGEVPPHVTHGSSNAYTNYGCRCDTCRAGSRERYLARKAARPEAA